MHVDLVALAVCAWLLTYALHSTFMIAVAWMASAFLARIGRLQSSLAVVRERLWKIALVGGIATATVQTALGGGPWGLSAQAEETHPTVPVESVATLPASTPSFPAGTESLPAGAQSFASGPPVFLDPASFARSLEAIKRESVKREAVKREPVKREPVKREPVTTPVPVASYAVPAAENLESSRAHTLSLSPPWIRTILALWCVGVLFGLARWTMDWRRLLAALRGRAQIVRGPAREIFDALTKRTGVGAGVRLLYAPRIAAPITIGFLRPAICLPPRATCDLQRDELEALLAHELAHAVRRDPAWLCACRAIEVAFFFQPLNRMARVQLADEAEYLCDDWAVRHTRERLSLASCLTEIAGWLVGRERELAAPGMAARGTRLELRVRRVLDGGDRPDGPDELEAREAKALRWVSPLACGAIGAVALLVPGVSARSGALFEKDLAARADASAEWRKLAGADDFDANQSRAATSEENADGAPDEMVDATPAGLPEMSPEMSPAAAPAAAPLAATLLADDAPIDDERFDDSEQASLLELEPRALAAGPLAAKGEESHADRESKSPAPEAAQPEPPSHLVSEASAPATANAPASANAPTIAKAPTASGEGTDNEASSPTLPRGSVPSASQLLATAPRVALSTPQRTLSTPQRVQSTPQAALSTKGAHATAPSMPASGDNAAYATGMFGFGSSAVAAPAATTPRMEVPESMLQLASDSAALADARAFDADITALEQALQALKSEVSRRRAPTEFQRRMKSLENELRTLQKHRAQLLVYMSRPMPEVATSLSTRTDAGTRTDSGTRTDASARTDSGTHTDSATRTDSAKRTDEHLTTNDRK